MSGWQLFVDLDGVLAAYDAGFERQFGMTSAELEATGATIWEAIGTVPTFYEQLDPLPDALDLWATLKAFHPDPVILTSAGEAHFAQNARSKLTWVRRHLGHDVLVVPVKGGRRKAHYAQRRADVLIDDFERNCEVWRRAGGTAIQHVSADRTAVEFSNIFRSLL